MRPNESYDAGEFIPANKPQYDIKESWKEEEEDGFDVYFDAIHNLPDNTSIVKTIVKLVNNRGIEQIRSKEIWPKLEVSSYQKQVFNEKIEVRDVQTDPTTLLQLTFVTIDVTSMKPKVLGYSFFPIFIDTETLMPVIASDSRMNLKKIKRTLHKGAYQMPIYYEKPNHTGKEVTYRDYIQLERIPTCTVLLRIDYSSIDYEGNFISI